MKVSKTYRIIHESILSEPGICRVRESSTSWGPRPLISEPFYSLNIEVRHRRNMTAQVPVASFARPLMSGFPRSSSSCLAAWSWACDPVSRVDCNGEGSHLAPISLSFSAERVHDSSGTCSRYFSSIMPKGIGKWRWCAAETAR